MPTFIVAYSAHWGRDKSDGSPSLFITLCRIPAETPDSNGAVRMSKNPNIKRRRSLFMGALYRYSVKQVEKEGSQVRWQDDDFPVPGPYSGMPECPKDFNNEVCYANEGILIVSVSELTSFFLHHFYALI